MERGEATARFSELIRGPADKVPLDVCAFLIAAHDHEVDIDAEVTRLDAVAHGCTDRTFEGLRRHLFEVEGFRGNELDYENQDNSFLDRVIDRKIGLPITLAVIAMEVGRRIGVPIVGVNAPGHFLARTGNTCFDPFRGGRLLPDAESQAALASAPEPPTNRQILERMLTNLQSRYAAAGDRESLTWVTRLRLRFPEAAARTAWLN